MTRILVEGGAKIAASLLRADLVDRIAWFHAPSVMGGDGWPAVQAFRRRAAVADAAFCPPRHASVGDDMLSEFARIE